MNDASTPQLAEDPTLGRPLDAPRVKVIVTLVEGADLAAALATVERQVYGAMREVAVIGVAGPDLPDTVTTAETLEQAIAEAGPDIDYLWILHSDARPRPDALAALVTELERNEASLGGSKLLVAGTPNQLESVGSATDVFGDPYSGLDEGEIDLEQYDVVREVAFVSSVSMLVRRDLAQGLGGLDPLLEPGAAGLDFSQRVRLAGGRVITVPSSEVYHQARCAPRGGWGWREEAGRLRSMVKAYTPLTLAWLIPVDFLVSVADGLANLLLLRWRPAARHIASWAWNLFHLPSTIAARRRFRPVRAHGDEELFRFQARGSVRLREVGSELTNRVLSAFDEDQALARGTRRIWSSPGIWGAVLAVLVVMLAVRSLFFAGVPNVGYSFPFEPPSVAAERYFAGWNDSGLGSPDSVHPSVGVTALLSFLWFGAESAARTMATIAFGAAAVVGMGRLAGRLGFRGPGRYLAGLVLLSGPGTAALTGTGSWLALAAAAVLPWAVRAVSLHPSAGNRSRLTHFGWAVGSTVVLSAISPVLGLGPLVFAGVWRLVGGSRASLLLAAVSLSGLVACVGFVYDDQGWVLDAGRRIGVDTDPWWPVLIAAAGIPLALSRERVRRLATAGAVLGLGGLILLRSPVGGPGVEEAALVTASFGAALLVSAALDGVRRDPPRLLAAVAAVVMLLLSAGPLLGGSLGLPQVDVDERLAFARSLAGDAGPGRILVASAERSLIPGEARPGPGFWYRIVDGSGMTHDEIWLPPPRDGDRRLNEAIHAVASGSELRPGADLAQYAVEWLMLDGPESPLDAPMATQLDMVPTPFDEVSRTYRNPEAIPMAQGAEVAWRRQGTGFAGPRTDSVRLAVNYSPGWGPEPVPEEWATMVSGMEGTASFEGGGYLRHAPWAAAGLLALSLVSVIVGRIRS